jgi:hypothetical protein
MDTKEGPLGVGAGSGGMEQDLDMIPIPTKATKSSNAKPGVD